MSRSPRVQKPRSAERWILGILTILSGIGYAIVSILDAIPLAETAPAPLFYAGIITRPLLSLFIIAGGVLVLANRRSPSGAGWIIPSLIAFLVTIWNTVAAVLQVGDNQQSLEEMIAHSFNVLISAAVAMLTVLIPFALCFYPLYLLSRRSGARAIGITVTVMSALIVIALNVMMIVWQLGEPAPYIADIRDTLIGAVALIFGYISLSWTSSYEDEDEDEEEEDAA
ncbi:MAG: hypothetical protein IJU16_00760 [Clostridia bacterium]|nr:hypothetical protein [Clostridia bacterium]